ncbi:MAG: phosphoribosylglycinamide formyltransferase [Enterococcus sp.]
MRVAIFASGNGSNFEAIAQSFSSGQIKGELALVFSDKPDAFVLERAEKWGITHASFSPKDFASKKAYEAELIKLLASFEIEFVVLAGYMRIIGPQLLAAFPKRIVNIHPSLLPAFPGLHGIKDAYDYGVKVTGVTVHYVDNGVDTGPIIAQAALTVEAEETVAELEARIHQIEHEIYPATLAKILN